MPVSHVPNSTRLLAILAGLAALMIAFARSAR